MNALHHSVLPVLGSVFCRFGLVSGTGRGRVGLGCFRSQCSAADSPPVSGSLRWIGEPSLLLLPGSLCSTAESPLLHVSLRSAAETSSSTGSLCSEAEASFSLVAQLGLPSRVSSAALVTSADVVDEVDEGLHGLTGASSRRPGSGLGSALSSTID